jgi:hypothetical protein
MCKGCEGVAVRCKAEEVFSAILSGVRAVPDCALEVLTEWCQENPTSLAASYFTPEETPYVYPQYCHECWLMDWRTSPPTCPTSCPKLKMVVSL